MRRAAQSGLAPRDQAGGTRAALGAGRDDEAEMIYGLRREFPAAIGHRVLAVDLDPGDPVVGGVTVAEDEPPAQADLDQRPHVGLLSIVRLPTSPAAGVRPCVPRIKRDEQTASDRDTGRLAAS